MGLVLGHWSGNNTQISDEGVEVGAKVDVETVSKIQEISLIFFDIWM